MSSDLDYFLKKREIYMPAAVISFVLLAFFIFILPKVKGVLSMRAGLKKQSQEISRLSQKLADLQTLSEGELYGAAEILLRALPAEKDFYQAVNLIKSIFQKYGVRVVSFSLSPGNLSESGIPMPIKLLFFSRLAETANLVAELERSLPLLTVSSLALNNASATASGTLQDLEVELIVKSYAEPLPKVLPAVDKPLPKISNKDRQTIEDMRKFISYTAEEESSVSEVGSVVLGRENPFPF